MLITRKTRDEAYFYASKARERKMHSAIRDVRETLGNNYDLDIQRKLD